MLDRGHARLRQDKRVDVVFVPQNHTHNRLVDIILWAGCAKEPEFR